ncbi:hypothetical protein NLU13_4834 [Sarocladium strictum]|uniref:Arrestin n=1 Tax=Sarocladium strictum TaxID=5046 RepID=A0AA39L8K3_SARSR|nr:hypothetical protein NLU13_4834 [Sarocladium strictum]
MATLLGASTRPLGAAGANVAHKSALAIKLDGHYSSKVYTSGSKVTGQVEVLSQHDVQYDDFEIIFTGVSSTRLDFVQQYTCNSWRPFMKLRMPLEEDQLPRNNIFRAGQRYIIPFHFVVPHQLTIGACSHNVSNPDVQQQHLRMPPSVGCWEYDDMAPDMAEIQYAVKVRALRRVQGPEEPLKLMAADHVLKVLPASPEEAPIDVSFRDEAYKLAKSKTIRKSLFSSKSGKLSADTAQPAAVMLSADGHTASGSSARVNLQFVPDSTDTAPPKINSVSAKLQVTTFFSGGAVDHLPNLGSRTSHRGTPSLSYSNNVCLTNNKSVDTVSWKREEVPQLIRRDSGYSSYADNSSDSDNVDSRSSSRDPSRSKDKSAKKSSPVRHTATIDVPVNPPTNGKKIWLPTFHNCLISRTYALQLTLSVGPTNTTLNLVMPLQIGVETIHDPQGGELPSFETAIAEAEAEEANAFFQPRVMQIPQMPQQSVLPGYESLGRQSVAVA